MPASKSSENITKLVRLAIVIAIVSTIVIVSLTGWGMNSIYSSHVVKMAKEESALVAHLIIDHNFDTLISQSADGHYSIQIDPGEVKWLNQSLSNSLKSLNIIKVKIFTPDARVVYSTENQLIGELNQHNNRLNQALKGEINSHIEGKDQVRDLYNELSLNVDVVETYIPIEIRQGEIIGALELYMDVTKFRDEIQMGTLKSLGLLCSAFLIVSLVAAQILRIAIKRAAAVERLLRKQAMIDTLTGVLNRRELMDRAEREVSRRDRFDETNPDVSIGLVLLDIDHFKKVNDSFGHQVGDVALRGVAIRIQEQLRPYDIFGRYGGEEFMVLLPKSNLEETKKAAERIRSCISDAPFMINHKSLDVSISLGVSSVTSGATLDDTIRLADKALYTAKKNGRNRVEVIDRNHSGS